MDAFRCRHESGAIGIADDIVVYGKTETEHDHNLHKLMQVVSQQGLMFNSQKCSIKTPQIQFFGMVYNKHGIHPDPDKVNGIKNMEAPQNKTELQQFLGI